MGEPPPPPNLMSAHLGPLNAAPPHYTPTPTNTLPPHLRRPPVAGNLPPHLNPQLPEDMRDRGQPTQGGTQSMANQAATTAFLQEMQHQERGTQGPWQGQEN